MNTSMPYEYASVFPKTLSSLIDRFQIKDIGQAIKKIAGEYFPLEISSSTVRGAQIKNLIVKTANHPWEILSTQSLCEIYPPSHSEVLFYMPKGYPFLTIKDYPYKVLEISNITALITYVQSAQPKNIYLQVSPHAKSEYLVILFHHFFPHINLTVEFYDMGLLFSDAIQKETRGYSDQDILQSCLSSWVAMNHCQAVVVKSAGADWEKLVQKSLAPCFTIYPMLDDKSLVNAGEKQELSWVPSDVKRILFAGSVTSSELRIGPEKTPGANFLEYFRQISQSTNTVLNIYNAAHKTTSDNDNLKFSVLEKWIAQLPGQVNYYSSILQCELVAKQAVHDFGFFCVHYADDKVEHVGRVAIPNRVMSYVCSGLPVIVDTRAEYMAKLIEKYNAGILIDPAIPGHLNKKIKTSNIPQLRKGVKKLREALINENNQQLTKLKALLIE